MARKSCNGVYKNAKSAYASRWNKAHPEQARKNGQAARERNRKIIQTLKAKPCMDCGGTFPSECMDFDHRDPLTKNNPGTNLWANWRGCKKLLLEEVAKCDIVCANCHRIRTARLIRSGEYLKIAAARKVTK